MNGYMNVVHCADIIGRETSYRVRARPIKSRDNYFGANNIQLCQFRREAEGVTLSEGLEDQC